MKTWDGEFDWEREGGRYLKGNIDEDEKDALEHYREAGCPCGPAPKGFTVWQMYGWITTAN